MAGQKQKNKSGFGAAGLVLGIVGLCTSFIPFINNLSFVMGILAVIFGIVALVKKSGKGKIIACIVLGILTITATLNAQQSLSDSLDTMSEELDKATGSSTEEILANNVDVLIGDFKVEEDEYTTETKLVVEVKNKASETKSFDIQIEAVNSEGTRIEQDYIYANNLKAGQSQSFEIFTYVPDDELKAMKEATFKIVEVSMY